MNLKFFYSGAGTAINPKESLGGARNSNEVVDIFDDVTAKKSRAGQVDYRCIYIKNDDIEGLLRHAKFYVDWERKSGSYVDVGVVLRNAIQAVEIIGLKPPNENDEMTLNVPTFGDFIVPYHVNITEWQGRFQTAMRGLDGLQDVIVVVAGEIGFPTDVTFKVYFEGQAASRSISLITLVDNSLNGQTISITSIQNGSPINIIACTVPSVTTTPACTKFDYPLRGNPIELGNLRPGDEFPVWLRRTTPSLTRIKLLDKIRFNVEGVVP